MYCLITTFITGNNIKYFIKSRNFVKYNNVFMNYKEQNFQYSPILIQGGSLKTWSYKSPLVEQVQVVISTDGRPMNADIELWNGPENTPIKMRVYIENGLLTPFTSVLETPRGPNTIAIRNIGQIEFPIKCNTFINNLDYTNSNCLKLCKSIQGGALRTYPFEPSVESIQIFIRTDGRPLNARIELLQGPNNNKQVIEVFTEDGCDRPFFAILETPGSGNVIRILNTSPVEFPIIACIVPHTINPNLQMDLINERNVVVGGDTSW